MTDFSSGYGRYKGRDVVSGNGKKTMGHGGKAWNEEDVS